MKRSEDAGFCIDEGTCSACGKTLFCSSGFEYSERHRGWLCQLCLDSLQENAPPVGWGPLFETDALSAGI